MNGRRVELAAALALGAALVLLGAAFGTSKSAADSRASTFVDSREGMRAAFLVLEGVGAKPRRLMRAPSASDPTDRTLVVARPSEPVTRREAAGIVDWVNEGGRLVVVAGPAPVGAPAPHERALLEAFGLRRKATPPNAGESTRIDDPVLGDGVGKLDWPAVGDVESSGRLDKLVTRGTRTLVGRAPWGDAGGEVVVVADDGLYANESLGKLDNAVLAVRVLLGRGSDDGRVVFDEFHHGFRDDGGPSHVGAALAAMLADTWPGRAVLVLLLAGGLAVAGLAVRLGAPERERPPPRRALSEHAEALGRLFESARARTVALRILAAGARRIAGPRTGILGSMPAPEFVRRLRASPAVGAAELADALNRADAGRASKDVEMAEIAANLAAAKRRLLHGGQ
jgi:hypothetical protein